MSNAPGPAKAGNQLSSEHQPLLISCLSSFIFLWRGPAKLYHLTVIKFLQPTASLEFQIRFSPTRHFLAPPPSLSDASNTCSISDHCTENPMMEGSWTSTKTATATWMPVPSIQAPALAAAAVTPLFLTKRPHPSALRIGTVAPTTLSMAFTYKPTTATVSVVVTPVLTPLPSDTREDSEDKMQAASVIMHSLAQMLKVLLGFIIFVAGFAALICTSMGVGFVFGRIKERGYDGSFQVAFSVNE